jgi:hypothetical protein
MVEVETCMRNRAVVGAQNESTGVLTRNFDDDAITCKASDFSL